MTLSHTYGQTNVTCDGIYLANPKYLFQITCIMQKYAFK